MCACVLSRTTLGRVAVVSCNRNESQTSELLKQVFHIESLHRYDFTCGSNTLEPLTVEIAISCIILNQQRQGIKQTDSSNVLHFLVVHVIGGIELIWPFLMDITDYLVMEDSTEESKRFHNKLETLMPHIRSTFETNRGIVIWKSSSGSFKIK